jgi:hypothetical protein
MVRKRKDHRPIEVFAEGTKTPPRRDKPNNGHTKADREAIMECLIENAKLGYSMSMNASLCGIGKPTAYRWIKEFPDFAEKFNNAQEIADREVVRSLYKRAVGFKEICKQALVVSDGMDMGSHVEIIDVEKYFPPETKAAQYWLQNRLPAEWQSNATLNINHSEIQKMSNQELEKRTIEILKVAHTAQPQEEDDED